MTQKLIVVIPVYNESQNIKNLSKDLNCNLSKFNNFYLFVDDCSIDNTIDLIKKYFKENDYYIIKKDKNIGPGDSFNRAFNWILENIKENDFKIVTIEGDGTSDLSILPIMITLSDLGFDLILASIYAQGGGFSKTSIFRKIISFSANLFIRFIYSIRVLTLSSFYRVYNYDLLRKLKSKYGKIINEKGFISMVEILLKSIKMNAKIIEVPMIMKSEKRRGNSKMKILKTSIDYISFFLKNI